MENQRPAKTLTKTQWRQEGRGVRRNAEPVKTIKCKDRFVDLYREDQTILFRPYTRSRNFLVDLFAGYPDTLGYRPKNENCIYRADRERLKGGPRGALEAGFNYRRCAAGIPIGKYLAESFHVTAGDYTPFVVIDVDNHSPNRRTTEIHLELVERLQERLPQLAQRIHAKSSFWQYRCIEPTGIQLWLVTKGNRFRRNLHQDVREFLLTLDEDGLDARLRSSGLAGLADIEILPSAKLISMPGCYGKLVFTDHELKIENQRFDCEALHRHIEDQKQAGNVHGRYRELVLVRDLPDQTEVQVPSQPAVFQNSTVFQNSSATKSNVGNGYWSKLKSICLHGIDQPDQLHGLFLNPVAQALLFREFHDQKDKKELTFQALKNWIFKKHNGLVSRINDGNFRLVENQIRSTIKNILKKPNKKILDYYARMRLNDSCFPNKKELLLPYMEANSNQFFLKDCKGCFSEQEKREAGQGTRQQELSALPVLVSERLQQYAETHLRGGRATGRFLGFARAFISEIGVGGERQINERTLLRLAGREPGCDTSFLKKWKKHLVNAGILRKGWEKNIVRELRPSCYRVQSWVKEELDAMGPACASEGPPATPMMS